jgi:hypothetical protein
MRTLVIACGALSRELLDIVRINRLEGLTIECLPAILHNTPDRIVPALAEHLARTAGDYDRIFVGYADCGTGGELDRFLETRGIERLPGAHCYEFYAGGALFAQLHEAEPGTFYLTDYLVRHFDRLVLEGLGIAAHPELLNDYFGHYTRLVHLAQTTDPELDRAAREAARRLGLRHERRNVGYGQLATTLVELGSV